MFVYPDGAKLEHICAAYKSRYVFSPYGCSKSIYGVIGFLKRVIHLFVTEDAQYGPEYFFLAKIGCVRNIGEDCRLHKKSFCAKPIPSAHQSSLLFSFTNETFHTVTMSSRNERPQIRCIFGRITHNHFLHFTKKKFEECIMHILMHIHARDRRTILSSIPKCSRGSCASGGLNIRIRQNHLRRFPPKFQMHTFHIFCRPIHEDFPS